MVLALAKEMELRKSESDETVETIYFGGGTPSVLSSDEIGFLIDTVYQNFSVSGNPEITIEANPDDLSDERISELANTRVNRLSIGIQSFFDDDLSMMNRAHNSAEAKHSLETATKFFDNISIDLIYGIPGMDNDKWKQNIETALHYGVPHISSYALTVEPKTALKKLIQAGKMSAPDDELAQQHFHILVEMLEAHNFIHYEVSNFARENYFSKNNSAYWLGKKYIGIGPSAHSYDGVSRSWNVSNNSIYLKSMNDNVIPNAAEILSTADRYNEFVMTGLRTVWGVSLQRVEDEFGKIYKDYLVKQGQRFLSDDFLSIDNEVLTATKKGKFLIDGIASDLFIVE